MRHFLLLSIVAAMMFAQTSLAGPIELKTGDPTKTGDFEFTLVAPDGTELMLSVRIPRTDNAAQKATKIQNAVQGNAGWDALRNADKLTFKHREGGAFKDVLTIKDINDKTGEKETITALAAAGIFDFGLDATVLASGFDDDGMQSFASVMTTGGDALVFLSPGDSASSVIDQLFSDLLSDGVNIQRTSPFSFRITDLTPNAFISFQVTDTNLNVAGAAGTSIGIPEPSTLLLLGLGGVLVLGRRYWPGRSAHHAAQP